MDVRRLDGILDNGWNSTKQGRIASALDYVSSLDRNVVIPVLEELKDKYKKQLEFQTKNITGSGCQQDFIDAYLIAYEACIEVIRKLQDE